MKKRVIVTYEVGKIVHEVRGEMDELSIHIITILKPEKRDELTTGGWIPMDDFEKLELMRRYVISIGHLKE